MDSLSGDARRIVPYMFVAMIIPIALPVVWILSIIGIVRASRISSQPEIKGVREEMYRARALPGNLSELEVQILNRFFERKNAFWYPTVAYILYFLVLWAAYKLM